MHNKGNYQKNRIKSLPDTLQIIHMKNCENEPPTTPLTINVLMRYKTISKEKIQMTNKYFNKCSIVSIIRIMQIRTILRSIPPRSEWLPSRAIVANAGKDLEGESFLTVDGSANWCNHYEISVEGCKKLTMG